MAASFSGSERGAAGLIEAALAFGIRVLSAGLVLGMQVLLARLMPMSGYGGFVTLWTWMLAIGSFGALGFAEAGVRFVPRYLARGREQAVGAFFAFGLRAVVAGSGALALLGVLAGLLLPGEAGLIAVLVALGLPFLAMEYYLEGIARGFGWYRLTTVPVYILRPLLIGASALALHAAGVALTLPVVGGVVIGAMAAITIGLALVLRHRLAAYRGAPASRARAALWLRAALPLIVVSGLDDLVSYADVLLVSLMLPPDQVAVYFAAARVLALANFVSFALYLVAGRRFALDLAARDRTRLQASLLQSTRLTFWCTLLAVAATLFSGPLLLSAFGDDFGPGYPVMLVLAVGVVARALSGQANELLIVSGGHRQAARILAVTLCVSVAVTIALVPTLGIVGVAMGTAIAMAVRTPIVAWVVARDMGLRLVSVGVPRLVSGPA